MKQSEVQREIPKKKDTVRISKKDLLELLSDNEHMTNQITNLQSRMSEMVEEIRVLKSEKPVIPEELKITPRELTPKDIEDILKPVRNSRHGFAPRSDIYFDGK
jgi:predicted nuclease with TOPRIM domain